MASRFTALPLGSGEAFLLQTEHDGRKWSILVDSGNLSAGTPHPLVAAIEKQYPKLRRIDVAICTHHDMDHARGFQTFSDAWCATQREIGEFWLPGRWSAALPAVMFDPLLVAHRLWNGAASVSRQLSSGEQPNETTYEERLRSLAEELKINDAFSELRYDKNGEAKSDKRDRIEHLVKSLGVDREQLQAIHVSMEERGRIPSKILRELGSVISRSPYPFWWDVFEIPQHASTILLFMDAIETAKTIASIAESAVCWQIPIRWFDFGQFEKTGKPAGGITGFLEPLSAVELTRPPISVTDPQLFLCLHLSKQNVESLVFHRIESETEPGVMFLGDSRLSFGIDKPQGDFPKPKGALTRRIIATAPHHGSEVNDVAYGIITKWLGGNEASPIYVRNGGHHKQTIKAFLSQPHRCCAQCRLCARRKLTRPVTLTSRRGDWDWAAKRVPRCKPRAT